MRRPASPASVPAAAAAAARDGGRPSECGQELLRLVGPTVEAALLSFVSEYPAPQFWDAAGAATQTRQLTPTFKPQPNATNRWQWDQKVIFFAELP